MNTTKELITSKVTLPFTFCNRNLVIKLLLSSCFFKGKKLVESILEGKKWPKSIPAITNREVAIAVGNLLCSSQFFHRSEKIEGKKSVLAVRFNFVLTISDSDFVFGVL